MQFNLYFINKYNERIIDINFFFKRILSDFDILYL